VERPGRDARRINAARLVKAVLGRIPASHGYVEASAKSDRVVDHHNLLMMRCASRQVLVQAKTDAPWRAPTQRNGGEWLAFQRIKNRIVPHQEMHGELRPLIDQHGQKIHERFRVTVVRVPALVDEPRAAVEVPTDDEYSRTRL
jgi:hypothetical protein